MNGEINVETPAMISAIVQDVQRAHLNKNNEKLNKPADYNAIDIIPIPQIQINSEKNDNEDRSHEIVPDPRGMHYQETATNQPSVELGMELENEDDGGLESPQRMTPLQVGNGGSDFRKEGTPSTIPVSKESPSPGAGAPATPIPLIREPALADSNPEAAKEEPEEGFVSPWSPGVFDDQPVVYMPPPVVETENDEELEELANVGRTERQLPMGSSHHLSAMFEHHHHHDDIKKLVRDLPLDSEPVRHSSDERKTHDEVSSHKLDHNSRGNSPEPPPQAKPPSLFRVPSVLEQMVDEPPAEEAGKARPGALFRVPSVLEQMMDEEPIVARDDEPPLTPPDVDEYKLDSAEFASDKQEGTRSTHSHHALHVAGSHAMGVTTCPDIHHSEAEFVLGDTEGAHVAEDVSSLSEDSVCEDVDSPRDENNYTEFSVDDNPAETNQDLPSKGDERLDEAKLNSPSTNGDQENKVVCEEERVSKISSLEEKESESDKNKVNEDTRRNSIFYIGNQSEADSENSELSSHREQKEDDNFYSEGNRENVVENHNETGENVGAAKSEFAEESPVKGAVPDLLAAEPRIPSLNELYGGGGDKDDVQQDAAEDVYDDYWAIEPDEPAHHQEFGNLDEVEAESHHRDSLLRPKPPPGRSERGCISAR